MKRLLWIITVFGFFTAIPTLAQQDFSNVEIKATRVKGNIYMLNGTGGNVGVSVGEDGVLIVDDKFAPLAEKIRAALKSVGGGDLKFILNTHWHGDHTGGNELLGGTGALIVAHENVRTRMASEHVSTLLNRTTPASPAGALPVVTFADAVTFHVNGQEIHAFHVDPAHTDGDAVVHFRTANVIHTGDVYFAGAFPFIDLDSGGSVAGVIAAVDRILALCDADTKIIPGHGPLSNAAELRAYRTMLTTLRDRIAALAADGKSLEEIQATKPTAEFDPPTPGFISSDQFVALVFADLTGYRPPE